MELSNLVEKSFLKFDQFKNVAKLFRVIELCFGLAFLLWTSARLPSALKISGYYFRQVVTMMISPLVIFIISNFIVITLLLNSSRLYPNACNDDETKLCKSLAESGIHCSKLSEIFDPVPVPDEIVYQDKQTISEVSIALVRNRESYRAIETVTDVKSCSEQKASPVRIQSENSKVDAVEAESCAEFPPTEIENYQRSPNPNDAPTETVDELTNEEFQRAIEDFIAKQIKFHREEK